VTKTKLVVPSKNQGDMKRRKPIVIPGDGDRCPRCGVPMQYASSTASEINGFFTRAGSAA